MCGFHIACDTLQILSEFACHKEILPWVVYEAYFTLNLENCTSWFPGVWDPFCIEFLGFHKMK